jgi:D-amino-acid dehydrogenase
MAKRILIVGGGVIGLCTAYYAHQRGQEVTIVDRGSIHDEGCSYGNAGLVVPSHFIPLAAPGMVAKGLKWMLSPESPFYVKPRLDAELCKWGWRFYQNANDNHVNRSAPLLRDLNIASRDCFESLASSLPDFNFMRKGVLMLCKSQETLEEESRTAEFARGLGMKAEILDKAETGRLDPNIRMDVAGSVYFPDDAHLSPDLFMKNLRAMLERLGVSFLCETEITGWTAQNSRVASALSPQGKLTADEYVLCGGSWSSLLAKSLGINLPIQAGKGYSLTIPNPPCLPSIPSILVESRLAVTPMGAKLRFGGTMEIAGLNREINPARIRGILKSIPKYYPDFSADLFQNITPWCGLRPCSPDGLPYVGRFKQYSNLSAATGHAMMGVSLGPITGKLMSEILSDQRTSISIEALSPDRYN